MKLGMRFAAAMVLVLALTLAVFAGDQTDPDAAARCAAAQAALDAKAKARPTTIPAEVADLRRTVAGMAKEIDELKAENRALKQQLAARPVPDPDQANAGSAAAPAESVMDPEKVGFKPGVKEADMLAYCRNHKFVAEAQEDSKDGRIYRVYGMGIPTVYVTVVDGEINDVTKAPPVAPRFGFGGRPDIGQ